MNYRCVCACHPGFPKSFEWRLASPDGSFQNAADESNVSTASLEGNMGPQGVELRFVTLQPTPQQLVAEAERIGGIGIETLDQTQSGVTVAFSGFPKGRVSISQSNPHDLFIIDHSLVAPALFRLLFRAGVALGGHSSATKAIPSLQLPLTTDAIRKATRRAYLGSALGSFWLLLLLAAAVVLIVGAFRLLSQNAL